jgi:hypothetical protein
MIDGPLRGSPLNGLACRSTPVLAGPNEPAVFNERLLTTSGDTIGMFGNQPQLERLADADRITGVRPAAVIPAVHDHQHVNRTVARQPQAKKTPHTPRRLEINRLARLKPAVFVKRLHPARAHPIRGALDEAKRTHLTQRISARLLRPATVDL